MEERRRYKRSSADCSNHNGKVLFISCGTDQEAATVINYSSSGLSLLTGKATPLDKELIIAFDQQEQTSMRLTGKVVWARPQDELWYIGINLNTGISG